MCFTLCLSSVYCSTLGLCSAVSRLFLARLSSLLQLYYCSMFKSYLETVDYSIIRSSTIRSSRDHLQSNVYATIYIRAISCSGEMENTKNKYFKDCHTCQPLHILHTIECTPKYAKRAVFLFFHNKNH